MNPTNPKILIVGGGVAGMSAGITLCRAGFSCEIYEKNALPGGHLGAWERQGYTIDNCIHWLEGTRRGTKLFALWEELGAFDRTTEFRRDSCFYRSTLDGKSAALYPSIERSRREWLTLSPKDKGQINAFFSAVKCLRAHVCRVEPLPYLPDMRIMPTLLRYGALSMEQLAGCFSSPLLRHALTDYIPGTYNALGLISTYASYSCHNASVPRGGSLAMALRMADTFRKEGGVLHLSAPVSRVCTSGSHATGILLPDGSFVRTDVVVCALDPAVTYGHLLPGDTMPMLLARRYKKDKGLLFSALQAAFACDADLIPPFGTQISEAPRLAPYGTRVILRDSCREEAFAPKGRILLQCMVPVSGQEGERWIALRDAPLAYADEKRALGEKMRLSVEAVFPAAAGKLDLLDVWTPATYARYHGDKCGAFMSFAVPGGKWPLPLPAALGAYENLFLATQWLRSPGGLPNAALAGQDCAGQIRRYLRKKMRCL